MVEITMPTGLNLKPYKGLEFRVLGSGCRVNGVGFRG